MKGSSVLLVTTRRWHSCARLAMAFAEAGFRVSVVCPGNHSVRKTSVVSGVWLYRAFRPLESLTRAIESASPQLIVPCDDLAVTELHALARGTKDEGLRELIASSMGSESSYAVSASRAAIHELAEELRIAVPRASAVGPSVSLEMAIAAAGLPAFLKTDGSSGGTGVCLVRNMEDAAVAYRRLNSPPSMLRAMKRAFVDRDLSLLPGAMRRRRARLSLQQAIKGTEANSTIFCWRGEVMASITVQVVTASMTHGPSTVVRRIDHAGIDRATAAIAKRLNLSGLCGFDFILECATGREDATGRALLIEMNARPTQTSHLALGEGRDLAAAAFAAVTRSAVAARKLATGKVLIALFPGEWLRDPGSIYIELGYHDVPQSEPELVRVCLKRPNVLQRLLTVQGWKQLREGMRKEPAGFSTKASPLEVKQLP